MCEECDDEVDSDVYRVIGGPRLIDEFTVNRPILA